MDNLRSRNLADATEPIVYSFDINSECKQYTFGLSQSQFSKTIDQNLFILKNTPFWKSLLENEVSCYEKENQIIISNFGEQFLGKGILIFVAPNQTNTYTYNHQFNSKNKLTTFTIKDSNNKEIDLSSVTIDYQIFIENTETDNKEVIYQNGIPYTEENLFITPVVVTSMVFNTSINFEADDVYLTLEDSNGDLVLLSCDYECSLMNTDSNVTSMIPIVNDKIENVYYTYQSDYDRVRFVISDYGRFISHSTSKNNSSYSDNKGFLLSVKTKNESNKNVSVRFTIDEKSYATNLTSNF